MFRLLSLALFLGMSAAFVPTTSTLHHQQQQQVGTSTRSQLRMSESTKNNEYLQKLSSENPEIAAEPQMNPDRPELPVIPGDYDWDSKYEGDPDWITGSAVPGKAVLNEIELAQQVTALGGLEEKWRKEREMREYEESINVGFVPVAETVNGRFAMFFLVTGLLTEYWTGISLPGQVEEMLRISGVIGFDG